MTATKPMWRHLAIAATALCLATGTTGCGGSHPATEPPHPTPPTSQASTGTPSAEPTESEQMYPDSAQAYATALVKAWHRGDGTRQAQLAAATAVTALAGLGSTEGTWSYAGCEGAAATSGCVFRNEVGD